MYIGDLARATGLSIDTLRYYEKIGLIPPPLRDAGGRRVYDAETLRWIAFLQRLKATGMGIADMLAYARLRAEGDQTSAPRRKMLETLRALVAAQIRDLTDCLEILDGKIETYRTIEAGLAADGQTESLSHDASNDRRAGHRRKPLRPRLETT